MRSAMRSIPAILLYVIGFPMYVLYIVKTYKHLIKEDQLLRALGLGNTQKENPFAYFVRVRYHRIYYHFKPSKTLVPLCCLQEVLDLHCWSCASRATRVSAQ